MIYEWQVEEKVYNFSVKSDENNKNYFEITKIIKKSIFDNKILYFKGDFKI
jgi:hypothetical protein